MTFKTAHCLPALLQERLTHAQQRRGSESSIHVTIRYPNSCSPSDVSLRRGTNVQCSAGEVAPGFEVTVPWNQYQSILKQMRSSSSLTQLLRCHLLYNWVPDVVAEASIYVILWNLSDSKLWKKAYYWKWGRGMPAGPGKQIVWKR